MADLSVNPPGLVHGLDTTSLPMQMLLAVFLAIALSNSLELIVLVCWTFKQYRGLYFWSLLISSIGIIPYTVGSILHYWNIVRLSASLTVSWIGYVAIIPVQSFILYSRLHLVFYHEKLLRMLLHTIIVVSILLLVPNSVTLFGSAFIGKGVWIYIYNVTERLQVTGFCVMELCISIIYIWATVRLLRFSPEGKSRVKDILYELLAINAIIIILDIAVIVVQFLNFYTLQVCLKVFVYSIKVKLEIAVLGRLVAITKARRTKHLDMIRRPSFVVNSYGLSDFTNSETTGQRPASMSAAEVEQSMRTRRFSGNVQSDGVEARRSTTL
ncbi:hypothetical protein BJX76DRAFT_341287 [Aspergillus varians]